MPRAGMQTVVFSANGHYTENLVRNETSREEEYAIRDRDPWNTYQTRRKPQIYLAGCGGIGWWFAQAIASSAIASKCYLYDNKVLRPFHQQRMNVPSRFLGINKAIALAAILTENMAPFDTIPYSSLFTTETISSLKNNAIVVDTTDSALAHIEIYKACKEKSIKYFRVSYDGKLHITISDKASGFCVGALPTGYGIIQTWGLSAAIAANLGCLALWQRLAVFYTQPMALQGPLSINRITDSETLREGLRYE